MKEENRDFSGFFFFFISERSIERKKRERKLVRKRNERADEFEN